ncbi:MAG TPA: PTS sugar transporter subunit IIA [Arachnia sp.]|nr:PTS sugar transporter subunit IIA [Arachnia sp.]HMT85767.1 PTS sugar transporter subunit IIA [Arachnia sp.]
MDITPALLFPQLDAVDRDDVLATLGQAVIDAGLALDTYVQALQEREAEFPTGLAISGGVAIPHTSAEYVTGNTLAVATLTSPVTFQAMGDPDTSVEVSTVFMLVFADSSQHLPLLSKIVKSLQDQGFVDAVRDASTTEALTSVLAARLGE